MPQQVGAQVIGNTTVPALSSWTLDELGAKMKCEKCGKRPERYYPARQSDAPGFARGLLRALAPRLVAKKMKRRGTKVLPPPLIWTSKRGAK